MPISTIRERLALLLVRTTICTRRHASQTGARNQRISAVGCLARGAIRQGEGARKVREGALVATRTGRATESLRRSNHRRTSAAEDKGVDIGGGGEGAGLGGIWVRPVRDTREAQPCLLQRDFGPVREEGGRQEGDSKAMDNSVQGKYSGASLGMGARMVAGQREGGSGLVCLGLSVLLLRLGMRGGILLDVEHCTVRGERLVQDVEVPAAACRPHGWKRPRGRGGRAGGGTLTSPPRRRGLSGRRKTSRSPRS